MSAGRLEQAQAAASPARGLQHALARQVVDDLHQVVLRHAMVLGQFGDRDQADRAAPRSTSARAGCSRCTRRVACVSLRLRRVPLAPPGLNMQ
jgi:hypothetical protein